MVVFAPHKTGTRHPCLARPFGRWTLLFSPLDPPPCLSSQGPSNHNTGHNHKDLSSSDDDKQDIEHNDDTPPIIGLFPTKPAADQPFYTLSKADKLLDSVYGEHSTMKTLELNSVGCSLMQKATSGRRCT